MGKAVIKTLEGPKWAYTPHITRSVTKTSLRKNPKKPKVLRGKP